MSDKETKTPPKAVPDYRQSPHYNPKLDHGPGIAPHRKGKVTSTVPSLEELNKPDFPPGQDPL